MKKETITDRSYYLILSQYITIVVTPPIRGNNDIKADVTVFQLWGGLPWYWKYIIII